jgi:hypothetical protein
MWNSTLQSDAKATESGLRATRFGSEYIVGPTKQESPTFLWLTQSLGIPDPYNCMSTEPAIKIGQSNAIKPVTEHILELAFTKATLLAAATGMLHNKIDLTKFSNKFPGPIDPTFFTTTILKDLKNPPALKGDSVGLLQPSKRLMWVMGSTAFEDHFVVAETAVNRIKMFVSIKLPTSTLQPLLNARQALEQQGSRNSSQDGQEDRSYKGQTNRTGCHMQDTPGKKTYTHLHRPVLTCFSRQLLL